jgi:hypothetical protein
MIQYYIQTPMGQEGPFTLETLQKTNINPQTPVWYEGIADWTNAGQVESLKAFFDKAGTPPPFKNHETSNAKMSSDFMKDGKKGFSLSLFHWVGIGVLVFVAFMYFSKQGDANPGSQVQTYSSNEVIDSLATNEEEVERQRINAKITAKNVNYRNNWNRFIQALAGDYKYSSLGGIYDLEAVVQNQTDYPLDEVHILISYIKDNGGTHKTENVTVYNVPANGKASMPAPDSDRGTSVNFEITDIKSEKMHFLYSKTIEVEGKDDPYFSRD